MIDNYHSLKAHHGHEITIAVYGDNDVNVALQCETCGDILMDFDKPDVPEGCLVVTDDEILESGIR
jgi:hypothetical protein